MKVETEISCVRFVLEALQINSFIRLDLLRLDKRNSSCDVNPVVERSEAGFIGDPSDVNHLRVGAGLPRVCDCKQMTSSAGHRNEYYSTMYSVHLLGTLAWYTCLVHLVLCSSSILAYSLTNKLDSYSTRKKQLPKQTTNARKEKASNSASQTNTTCTNRPGTIS